MRRFEHVREHVSRKFLRVLLIGAMPNWTCIKKFSLLDCSRKEVNTNQSTFSR